MAGITEYTNFKKSSNKLDFLCRIMYNKVGKEKMEEQKMYERSAIVLERYLDNYFGFTKEANLKANYQNYKDIVEEMKQYRDILMEEDGLINQFDETAKNIQEIQSKQSKLYESNLKMEEERNKLFNDLSDNPNKLELKMEKIEKTIEKNNQELVELRKEFIKAVEIFAERQKERNKITRKRRIVEENHISYVEKTKKYFEEIDSEFVKKIKEFASIDKEELKKEINNLMIKNGKNEKVGFNKDVIEKAVTLRIAIAEKESECYSIIFDRTKKLINEIENEDIKLTKYEKILRDVSVKLAFLEAEKDYIVGFLDNERMTAMSGPKAHKKMMEEACQGFVADTIQINNLYELIIRETTNKSTKKAYKELYNKTYLKNIEEKEKNFEQEVNNIKIRMGTVINSNYWRIEGIKNIYTVFQKEVSEKFEKDLSEFKLEIDGEEQEPLEETENTKETIKPQKSPQRRIKISIDEDDEDDFDDFEDEENIEEDDEIEEDFDEDDIDDDDDFDDKDFEEDETEDEFDENNFEMDDDDWEEDDSMEEDSFDDDEEGEDEDDDFFEDDEDDDEFFDDEDDDFFDEDDNDFEEDEDDTQSSDEDFEIEIEDDLDSDDNLEKDEEKELDNKNSRKKVKAKDKKAKDKKEDDNKGLFNKLFKK